MVVGNGQQLSIMKEVTCGRRRPRLAGRDARIPRARHQHLAGAGALRRDHGRSRHAGAGLSHVRGQLGDAERRRRRASPSTARSSPRTTRRPTGRCSRNRLRVLRFRAVINPDLLDGTTDHQHRHGDVERPAADRERQRLDRRRRHPGRRHPERQGVARRELQQDAGSQRARARGLDRRAVSQRPAAALGDDRRERRVPHQRRPAELHHRRSVRAALQRAGRDGEHREARPGVLAELHQRAAADPRHHRGVRAATCRT